jgi:DNA polymerase III subunit delta'
VTTIAWSTVGNETALSSLERALLLDSPVHAYLFSGPESVGKRHAALEFAAALNCQAETRPCRVCRSCLDTVAGRHPDVEFVAPGGLCDESDHRDHADSRDLRICQVRRLERILSLTPYGGGRRVAIIDAADSLRTEAANAFLKTLEEPPEGTVLILLASREDQLPDTVLSRCQHVAFERVPRATIVAGLASRGASPELAETIAALAAGRPGWAFQALADETLLSERRQSLDAAVRIAHGGRSERFAWARGAEDRSQATRERYQRELEFWAGWWRDILSTGAGTTEGLANIDRRSELEQESKLYSPLEIVAFLHGLEKTREYLKENVDPQLALENLVLDLPRPKALSGGSR